MGSFQNNCITIVLIALIELMAICEGERTPGVMPA